MEWNNTSIKYNMVTVICERGNERIIVYCIRESDCKSPIEFYEENGFKCKREV